MAKRLTKLFQNLRPLCSDSATSLIQLPIYNYLRLPPSLLGNMYLSAGEINPKDGIGRPKVIEFINVPSILVCTLPCSNSYGVTPLAGTKRRFGCGSRGNS
jgi:hypothetical protein